MGEHGALVVLHTQVDLPRVVARIQICRMVQDLGFIGPGE